MEPSDPPQRTSDPEQRVWVMGILLGLVVMAALLLVWRHWDLAAIVWTILVLFGCPVLPLKWRGARTVIIALFVGTLLALLFH